jgi:putative sterol carrier protein
MTSTAEMMRQMPSAFNAEKAGDMNAVVQFDFTSDGNGYWYVTVADGTCSVSDGETASPTAKIIMNGEDYVKMVRGELNAVTAFMMGQIKVEGDLSTVMKFQTLFE